MAEEGPAEREWDTVACTQGSAVSRKEWPAASKAAERSKKTEECPRSLATWGSPLEFQRAALMEQQVGRQIGNSGRSRN